MFGKLLVRVHPISSMGGSWVERPVVALIRPSSVAVFMFVVLAISFVRRELNSVRKWAISLLMRHVRILQAAALIVLACSAGCNQPDKFAGFASEQLNTKMDEVLSIIEAQTGTIQDLTSQVRALNKAVDESPKVTQSQLDSLTSLESKLRTRLVTTPPKGDVGTLDVNTAPEASLVLDSLDDAAKQIMALQKRIEALEAKSALKASNYPAVSTSSGNGNGSTGGVSSNGSSGGTSTNYSQAVYSAPVIYSAPVAAPQYYSAPMASNCYYDSNGNLVCDRSVAGNLRNASYSNSTVRRGLFGWRR